MHSSINNEIYSFISRLERKQLAPMSNPTNDRIGSNFFHLGEAQNAKLLQTDPTGSHVSAFHDVDGVFVGLSETPYSEFKSLISTLQDLSPFNEKSSYSFIEEHSFQWLINVYRANRADQSLSDYLLDRLHEEYRSYTFYIPVIPLMIQTPFSIGNVEISSLSESFIEAETKKFIDSGNTKERLDEFLSHFNKDVLAIISTKGTFDKARQMAFRQAAASMDVLKCFLHEYSVYNQFKIPDLNFRQSTSEMASILHSSDSSTFSLEAFAFRTQHAAIIDIDQMLLEKFNQENLEIFSRFLTNTRDTEFHQAVAGVLHSFANYVSTPNWHEKVAKLITLFESILINAQTKAGGGENILKKQLMPKMFGTSPDSKLGIELSGTFYRIRDAYVHHGIERGIDARKLYQFQTIAFRFLRWLIKLDDQLDTMDSFYNFMKVS